jgi:hypothetical protein
MGYSLDASKNVTVLLNELSRIENLPAPPSSLSCLDSAAAASAVWTKKRQSLLSSVLVLSRIWGWVDRLEGVLLRPQFASLFSLDRGGERAGQTLSTAAFVNCGVFNLVTAVGAGDSTGAGTVTGAGTGAGTVIESVSAEESCKCVNAMQVYTYRSERRKVARFIYIPL